MSAELQNAFPNRPLRVVETGVASSWLTHIIALACLAGGIAFGAWQGPSLLRDNEIRQNPVVVVDGRLSNAKCRTRKVLFTECEADVAWAVDGRRYTYHADIFFIDFSPEGYQSGVVRSATKPEVGTMTIAIDFFWDRVMTVLGFSGILILIGVFSILAGIRNSRVRRIGSAEPVLLSPTFAQITARSDAKGGSTFVFKAEVDGKLREFKTTFGRDQWPFQTADGYVVAVIPQGMQAAILLDSELKRVDLIDEERQRFRSAAGHDVQAAA